MCLAIPARVVKIDGERATVDAMGNQWQARTSLLEEVKVGDLVLVHAGFAISLVDEQEAKKTWEMIREIDDFDQTPNKISG